MASKQLSRPRQVRSEIYMLSNLRVKDGEASGLLLDNLRSFRVEFDASPDLLIDDCESSLDCIRITPLCEKVNCDKESMKVLTRMYAHM